MIQVFKNSGLAALLVIASVVAQAETAQERLAASVQSARTETQNTRTELQNTVAALTTLQAQTEGDLRPNFDKLVASMDSTRSAAGLTTKRFDTMTADSQSYFDSWKAELDKISNKDIRKTSEKRLASVQKEYAVVLAKLGKTRATFPPMLSDCADLKTALGTDLTPKGLKSQKGAVNKTNKSLAAAQGPVIEALLAFDKLAANLTPVGSK